MRTVDDFLRQTALVDPRFMASVDFREFVRGMFDYSATVWEGPLHVDFVDHGLEHSFNVLRKARLILEQILRRHEGHDLSDLERAVLTVAALIHDTGMQWDKYEISSQRLGAERSRREHVRNGIRLVEQAMEPRESSVPSLRHLTAYHSFIGYAAQIGMAHSGPSVWDSLVESAETDWGTNGQPLRFKLLAAALRLADEIDNSYSRITEFGRLLGASLDTESLAPWYACYYIDDVRIADTSTGLLIEVAPRIPISSSEEMENEIIYLIDNYRIKRMREECDRVIPFLRTEHTLPPLAEPRRVAARRQPIDVPAARIREFLGQQVARSRASEKAVTERLTFVNVIASANAQLDSASQELAKVQGAGTLYSPRHVALRSGWHCTRYYQFSRLLGDGPFLDLITRGLAETYAAENFGYVIGIGTSGAQLASRLALVIGARFAYTFGSGIALAEPGLRAGPTDYEMEITLEPDSRVLIVDDIVGKGTSIGETVSRLRALKDPPAHIRAFCLIATGSAKEMLELEKMTGIDTLKIVGDIEYYPEDSLGYCEICQSQRHIVVRER